MQQWRRQGNKEFDADTEKKGLGTPATRASIIEKLVHSQYACRKGKQIVATDDGQSLIEITSGLSEIGIYDGRMGESAAGNGTRKDPAGTVPDWDPESDHNDAERMRSDQ